MISAVIIEDEKLIAAELQKMLSAHRAQVDVVAVLGSVQESLDYFSEGCHADLIFSDIQLPDGLSFAIFEKIQCDVPVVFTTGYDSFIMNALEHNGIDYLMKPVDEQDLAKVLDKYKNLEKHFLQKEKLRGLLQRKKERIIVKKGFSNVLLKLEDILLFYTENRVVYVCDREGRKYVCEQNLAELEEMLDRNNFFRANRQYIINVMYIKGFKTHERVRLSVDVAYHDIMHSIIVSQESAPYFRKWIQEV